MRRIQELAVAPVLAGHDDVLVIAGTAGGKTEAAWLPIFSALLSRPVTGLGVLCVSPLKALIDDQVNRLAGYGKHLGLAVDGWHGDISASRKRRVLETPPAGLVITPESLQGLLLNKRDELSAVVRDLRYVVIDEVHAFAGTDRGLQLQSLLLQLEDLVGHRVPRVALSATVSVPALITEFVRPGDGPAAQVLKAPGRGLDLDVEVLSFDRTRPQHDRKNAKIAQVDHVMHPRDAANGDRLEIAAEIDRLTRGRRALVFAGSRLSVEEMAVLLGDKDVTGTTRPQRFYAHHGSLSRDRRRSAEAAMHQEHDAVTVCTSTLELGVDLPHLDLVAQVDTCLSVAGLRQRLGRSGRRENTRPTLRCFLAEEPTPTKPVERLRAAVVQTVASIELILEDDWVEPADLADLGLSTLVHQVIALLADGSGSSAAGLYDTLCVRGPWRRVTAPEFAQLLRGLAARELLRQERNGELLLDEAGLALVAKRDFLTVFNTPAEYAVRHDGKELGTLPTTYPLAVGSTVAFAGRLWQVDSVTGGGWIVNVVPHSRGLPPIFRGEFGNVHEGVRQRMRELYRSTDVPTYLDPRAAGHLGEGRAWIHELGLLERSLVACDAWTLVALWTGDRQQATLVRWIERKHPELNPQPAQVGVLVNADPGETQGFLHDLLSAVPTGEDLAQDVLSKASAKYDSYLTDQLLTREYASKRFDLPGAVAAVKRALAAHS